MGSVFVSSLIGLAIFNSMLKVTMSTVYEEILI
ncbi:hypothetical protein SAMN05216500_11351 [Acinetobacter sp. DSM 11652]|nr:hypothetical protein SAMN05216500_11351 [Acinetobacter sp. DSM 11652]